MAADPDGPRQQWDRVAAGWRTWWETIERSAQAVSSRLLALADVSPGQSVLDLATGLGEPALAAARRVGQAGRVIATDLSPQMLALARDRATAQGLTNVAFIEADAAQLDFPPASFDAILCRWGVTSLPDPRATLVAVRRLLTPRGAFATSVWEDGPTGRPLATLANALAHELFGGASSRPRTPPHGASVQQTLVEELRRAGFSEVRAEVLTLTLAWQSPSDCVQYLLDVSPDLGTTLAGRSSAEHAAFKERLAARLQWYSTADGVRIPNVTICAVGRN